MTQQLCKGSFEENEDLTILAKQANDGNSHFAGSGQ